MATANEHLVAWLRDAHAMEEQAITMLTSQSSRLENYPELKTRIDHHLQETKDQAAMLERCLERLDGGTSSIKDISGKIVALGQGLSGLFVGDEVVKGTLAGYTFEHMEIASYRILIAAAEQVGDQETKRVCESILQQEIAMAEWLGQHAGEITRRFLERDQQDVTAKH
ncbi:ferritin-like domain-containing protein [Sinorhizobium arboris]|uniref:ferritin-like domain-containing protein n=1 Tax=Sinorhizobium arboris TaxID=76745 RepID=UPI00041E2B73|nr:ferritin-like domain-containing protein [Sinorhizobium arboris]